MHYYIVSRFPKYFFLIERNYWPIVSRRTASKCCTSSMVYYSPLTANAQSCTSSDGTQFGRMAARAVTHTLTYTITLEEKDDEGGRTKGPGGVRAKVRLGHVNDRLRRRRSISPAVRTSAEKDPPRTRERTSARARITGVLASLAGAQLRPVYPFERQSVCTRSSTNVV